ncbi:MAG: nucleotide exchange factor GrpE [Gemmatimonadota bacterium]
MTEDHTGPVAPENEGTPEAADEALRDELERTKQQYLRAVADYQNLQRRSQEERQEFGRYQLTALVLNFLPVLDDLERALESIDAAPEQQSWLEGVQLVAQKFRGVLEASGIQEIHALNQPFNPELHEAAGSAPGPDGQVIHLVRRGYTLQDRVIRAAMVIVGNGEPAPAGGAGGGASQADETNDSRPGEGE